MIEIDAGRDGAEIVRVIASRFGEQELVARRFVEAYRKERLETRQFNHQPEQFQPFAVDCLTWPSPQPARTSDRAQE